MLFDRFNFYSALQVTDFKQLLKIIHPMKSYCNTLEGRCSIQLSYGRFDLHNAAYILSLRLLASGAVPWLAALEHH